MRPPARLFRFIVQVQGAIVLGARLLQDEEAVAIDVRRHGNAKPRCCMCATPLTGAIREVEVRWRHLDLMKRRAYLVANVREGYCPNHGRRLERVPWAGRRARHTHGFDRQVASLAQVADKTAATRMFGVAWRTVGRIVQRVVKAFLPRDLLDDLVAIGVDETSYKRRHQYITVVSCLTTGRVVWVGKGKSSETLGKFFEELGPDRAAKLLAVAMDLSDAYAKAVRAWAPNADLIFDRFHVVQLLMRAIDEIRREECAKLSAEARRPLKKTRFALLRSPRNSRPEDEAVLARVARANDRLYRAYLRRVSFEDFWDSEDEESARKFIMNWTRSALLSRLQPLRRFASTVREHLHGILGFFRWGGESNATLEGTCNKVKLIMHRAFGFHSLASLVAMIHLCCSGIVLT